MGNTPVWMSGYICWCEDGSTTEDQRLAMQACHVWWPEAVGLNKEGSCWWASEWCMLLQLSLEGRGQFSTGSRSDLIRGNFRRDSSGAMPCKHWAQWALLGYLAVIWLCAVAGEKLTSNKSSQIASSESGQTGVMKECRKKDMAVTIDLSFNTVLMNF